MTPRAPGINQTGLHKFPNRGKTNTGNCKSLAKEISFGKRGNISYLVLEVWVCCGWGRGGPWKEIGYDLNSIICFMRFQSHRHYPHDFDSPWGEINGSSSLAIPIMISSHHVRDHHDGDHQHNHRHHHSHLEVRLMAPAASRSPSWSLSLFMSRSASVSAILSVSSWEKKYYQIEKNISSWY